MRQINSELEKKPHFYSSDIRGLHRAKLSPYQKRFYAKLYRLRIIEQKRFVVGGAKYTEDLKRLSACGVYEGINAAVKADIFRLDIADVSGSIRLFSDIMKRLGIRLAGDELYEEFQRIYDESVSRDAGKEKTEDKMWNRGRWR